MTEDDKKYIKEELKKLSTYAKSPNVIFLMENQYEGWYPKFHRYHDKKAVNSGDNKAKRRIDGVKHLT